MASTDETTPHLEAGGSPDDDQQPNSSVSGDNKWPGWPGFSVFRVIVLDSKVGTIIGRKGELIKKLCEDTRARVRILEPPPVPTTDRIVLVWAKEELEVTLPPAMDAVVRIFKRVNGLVESDGTDSSSLPEAIASAFCSLRLLVASAQALSLIGKQGSVIKSIQESSGASVRVLSETESPLYISKDEKIIELQGEAPKIHEALVGVLGHLRKYLVDHSVLPLFEKYNTPNVQEHPVDMQITKPLQHAISHTGGSVQYSMPTHREMIYLERDGQLESKFPTSGVALYEQDTGISSIRSPGFVHLGSSFVTQVTKTMQIPLSYAEDIIGIAGTNIAYIRRTSGATLTVQESKGFPDEITVEIKGTSSQVQIAQRLIQDFISNHKEPVVNDYGYSEMALRPSSILPHSQHTSSSLEYGGYVPSEIPGRLGSSGVGDLGLGNNTFRL